MSSPRVRVIIVHYNRRELLASCLGALAKTTYAPMEIVVVDNASSDGSADWVAAHYPAVRMIRSESNLGFCKGNNLAIRQTDAPLMVLLNNDVEVTPGWLEPLVAEMESQPLVAACQPKIRHVTERDRFDYAGSSGGLMDVYGCPFTRGRIFDCREQDIGQYDDPTDIFWASGAAIMLRRDALDECGLLNEQFVMHMEEIDLCWRFHLAGWRVRVRPDACVYHLAGGTLGAGGWRKMYYNQRNSLRMLVHNYGRARLLRRGVIRMLLDAALVMRSLLTLDFRRFTAVCAAWLWMWTHPLCLWSGRRKAQSLRRIADSEIDRHLWPHSVAWAHFVCGLKTWSEIRKNAAGC